MAWKSCRPPNRGHPRTYFGDHYHAEEMQDRLQSARREFGAMRFGLASIDGRGLN
ncbi:hypothetical protein GBA52_024377 [Prunus armeniaca]|nr:hypothetical protein GBA52_024377 [Prunus armeniaca]